MKTFAKIVGLCILVAALAVAESHFIMAGGIVATIAFPSLLGSAVLASLVAFD